MFSFFFFQAEDGIRDKLVTGVQTCALPILRIESGTSRAWPVSARAEECENMTGARVVWSASDIVASLTWERSTTIPSRFISCTTSRPNAERPRRAVSVEAVAHERLRQWVSVM